MAGIQSEIQSAVDAMVDIGRLSKKHWLVLFGHGTKRPRANINGQVVGPLGKIDLYKNACQQFVVSCNASFDFTLEMIV